MVGNMIKKRIEKLREVMRENSIDAYIINGSDPHSSEYPPERWETRNWLTGFTGSAGTVVITLNEACLWTDSRYFLQADEELKNTGIRLFKAGLPGIPEYTTWLAKVLSQGQTVSSNAYTTTLTEKQKIERAFDSTGIRYVPDKDLLNTIWKDRPSLPDSEIFQLDLHYCGKGRSEKIKDIRREMEKDGIDWYFISSLSDIAWSLNLRGNDIPFNPLFLSFLLIGKEQSCLFTKLTKLSADLISILNNDGIQIKPYDKVDQYLRNLSPGSVLLSPSATTVGIRNLFNKNWKIIQRTDYTTEMKAVKNETELSGIRAAMIKDGAALVKFMIWLEENWGKQKLDEVSVADILTKIRSCQDGFMGPSFETIAGFNSHGAIVHYSAKKGTAFPLDRPGTLLLDSGGQYLQGTTDITRVILLGDFAREDIKKDYTLVLKGHINLAEIRFPEGTTGIQLDTLARYYLWMEGKNYLHGTGHGVGHFLSVHEGPQSISTHQPSTVLKPGMIVSNEPGFYREGHYGIRIENLVAVSLAEKTESGQFYKFETLSLCPLERQLIDTSLLTAGQKEWINVYHKKVFNLLSPVITQEEKTWLKKKTAPLE